MGEPKGVLPRDRREEPTTRLTGLWDVARYITGMITELEAMANAARLDQLVYFLGMAKVESEVFVRTYGAPEAERAEEESDEPAVGPHQEKNSFD